MLFNCIKDLLNLKGVIVKSIKNLENVIEIYAELPISNQICPKGGAVTSKFHDYYTQPINDIPIMFKTTTIFLKKTRYEGKCCDKSFFPKNSIVAKYSRNLLLSRRCHIQEKNYDELENMLINYFEELRIAYREKECLLDILHSNNQPEIKKKHFEEWVKRNLESCVPLLVACAKTYHHWSYEIKNSLEIAYSNGPTEGTNNKIKTLKHITFGMPKIKSFKARIMLLD